MTPKPKKRLFSRDKRGTAFSAPNLIIGGLQINLFLVIAGIIFLAAIEKEIMPLGTLGGAIVGYFAGKGMQKDRIADKVPCGVCGTTATFHTGEQCLAGAAAKREEK